MDMSISESNSSRRNGKDNGQTGQSNNNPNEEKSNAISQPKSLIAASAMKEDSIVPAAMPLIRRISLLNSKEPDFYQKVRRT